jgi:hypothetical protein
VAAASNCYSVRLDFLGDVAQLVERGLCKPEVEGSIPFVSTFKHLMASGKVAPRDLSDW